MLNYFQQLLPSEVTMTDVQMACNAILVLGPKVENVDGERYTALSIRACLAQPKTRYTAYCTGGQLCLCRTQSFA